MVRSRGYYTVLHLVQHNAKVYIGARSQTKADKAIVSIRKQLPSADIQLLIMDHMSLESVVAAAKGFISKEPALHGLINNAGIMAVPWEQSQDGYESQWQTNYLSHWLLTFHLLPILCRTAERLREPGVARIVNVSSQGHRFAPTVGIDFLNLDQKSGSPYSRYGVSKLGNILHAKEIDRRYGPRGECTTGAEGIRVAAIHPGNSPTNSAIMGPYVDCVTPIFRLFGLYISIDQCSYNSLYVSASDRFSADDSGQYFTPIAKKAAANCQANDMKMAAKLWEWTEREMKEKGLL
ncbi:hypothetical protein N7448_008951 [Penicillium atrosanguineum]|nr:hypothetical protein N7448_008951 [Penicillium atrosanguineum]KAJ5148404.1 hypothetical protein N7526_001756 [Penicillium atrosanguineum]